VELSFAVAVSISESWSRRSAQACALLINKLDVSVDPAFRASVVECFMEHHSSDLIAELDRLPIVAAAGSHRLVYGASEAEFSAVVGLLGRAASGTESDVDLHRIAAEFIARGQSWVLNRVAGVLKGATFAAENLVVERQLRVNEDASVDDVRELNDVAVAAEDVAPVKRLAASAQRG